MKISFIVKGLIRNKAPLFREIKNFFPDAEIFETAHAGHAVDLAASCAAENYSHVIAVGGDGTLSEVVNGMLKQEREKLPSLGLLTCGTANDFSKTAGLDGTLKQLKNLVEKEATAKIDIGQIRFTGINNKPAVRYFINIADIGIGGCIVENINKSNKILGANGTFFFETLKAMFSYRRSKVKFVSKEFQWEGKTLSMVIANGKYFGSGLCIAPDASLDDGQFSVVILGDITVIDYLKNISRVKKGQKINNPEVFYKGSDNISITPLEASCPIDLDGEFIGYAPATFTILPGKINFLME